MLGAPGYQAPPRSVGARSSLLAPAVERGALRGEAEGVGARDQLGAAEEEDAAGAQRGGQVAEDLVPGRVGQVDDDVAADDQVEVTLGRVARQVGLPEGDLGAHPGSDVPGGLVLALNEEPVKARRGDVLELRLRVRSAV